MRYHAQYSACRFHGAGGSRSAPLGAELLPREAGRPPLSLSMSAPGLTCARNLLLSGVFFICELSYFYFVYYSLY